MDAGPTSIHTLTSAESLAGLFHCTPVGLDGGHSGGSYLVNVQGWGQSTGANGCSWTLLAAGG